MSVSRRVTSKTAHVVEQLIFFFPQTFGLAPFGFDDEKRRAQESAENRLEILYILSNLILNQMTKLHLEHNKQEAKVISAPPAVFV